MVSVCLASDALLQYLLSYLGFSYLERGVSLHCCSSKAQPLLLTLEEGYLLTSAPSDLERGIAPLGPPEPYFYLFQIIELVIYVRKIIIILHTPKTHCKNCFTVVIIDVFI